MNRLEEFQLFFTTGAPVVMMSPELLDWMDGPREPESPRGVRSPDVARKDRAGVSPLRVPRA